MEAPNVMSVVIAVISCNKHEVIKMSNKLKLQVAIDSDVKKNLAKLAIDRDKTMSELVEEALQLAFFSDRTKTQKL